MRANMYDGAMYIYARGYYDGRANAVRETALDWMTPEEVGIYSEGYDRGMADYARYDEPRSAA